MADDKSNRGARDRATISEHEDYEVKHLMEVGRITRERAIELIRQYRGNREKIMQALGAR